MIEVSYGFWQNQIILQEQIHGIVQKLQQGGVEYHVYE